MLLYEEYNIPASFKVPMYYYNEYSISYKVYYYKVSRFTKRKASIDFWHAVNFLYKYNINVKYFHHRALHLFTLSFLSYYIINFCPWTTRRCNLGFLTRVGLGNIDYEIPTWCVKSCIYCKQKLSVDVLSRSSSSCPY